MTYLSYGSKNQVRFLGRVLLIRKNSNRKDLKRGIYSFMQAEVPGIRVVIKVGSVRFETVSDRGGYIDCYKNIELEKGIHDYTVEIKDPEAFRDYDETAWTGKLLILDHNSEYGIISDIDDTILNTNNKNPFASAFNTIIKSPRSRRPIEGMPRFLRYLQDRYNANPVFYISTGTWNFSRYLLRFISKYNYPMGPILLRDWGPTQNRLFIPGHEHKTESIKKLISMFPKTKWIFLGDDTIQDPKIYFDLAADPKNKVEYIFIKHQRRLFEKINDIKTKSFTLDNGYTKVVISRDGYAFLKELV
jgi:phosphatidate phosphatase APP1